MVYRVSKNRRDKITLISVENHMCDTGFSKNRRNQLKLPVAEDRLKTSNDHCSPLKLVFVSKFYTLLPESVPQRTDKKV